MMLPTEVLDLVFSQIHLKTAAPTCESSLLDRLSLVVADVERLQSNLKPPSLPSASRRNISFPSLENTSTIVLSSPLAGRGG